MRVLLLLATLLALCAPLTGCKRSLSTRDVNEFIDRADDAARKGFAPDICALRGKNFTLNIDFQGHEESYGPTKIEMNRKLFCQEAGKFAKVQIYNLERKSIDISLAPDRKTAVVKAEYEETMPYFEPDVMPSSPHDFRDWQVVKTRDESVVGIEGGDLVFLSTRGDAVQSLLSRKDNPVPFK